jgi:hypothetical protein
MPHLSGTPYIYWVVKKQNLKLWDATSVMVRKKPRSGSAPARRPMFLAIAKATDNVVIADWTVY